MKGFCADCGKRTIEQFRDTDHIYYLCNHCQKKYWIIECAAVRTEEVGLDESDMDD